MMGLIFIMLQTKVFHGIPNLIIIKQNFMGQFLGMLSKEKRPRAELDFFKENSISKIKQFYSLYNHNSDALTIDDTEFAQIFGVNKLGVFQVLDTDKNLLIDSLELFSGLALLSSIIKFEDKIEFLFGLFDFNDLKSLSKTDLQFLFLSCCQVVHKLFSVKTPIRDQWICQFIREQFRSDRRINISEILKWAKSCDMVTMFLQQILKKPEKNLRTNLEKKVFLKIDHSKHRGILTRPNLRADNVKEVWLMENDKIFEQSQSRVNSDEGLQNCDIKPKISWVYGIRSEDTKQFIDCVTIDMKQWIVYYVGKVVVLFNVDSFEQKHYTEHSQQIISITASNTSPLIASGQYAEEPEIKIWNFRTMETLHTIKGVHKNGVHLLKFVKDDQLFVACGCGQRSPIIVYSMKTFDIVFSIYCQSPAVEITPLHSFVKKNKVSDNHTDNEFIIASLYGIRRFQIDEKNNIKCVELANSHLNFSRISCCAFIKINSNLKYLTQYDGVYEKYAISGHQKGQIYVWKLGHDQQTYKLSQQTNEVIRIVPTQDSIIVATDSSYLDFWDLNLVQKYKKNQVDITQISQKFFSYDLCEVILLPNLKKKGSNEGLGNKNLLLMTRLGDIFILGGEKPSQPLFKYKLNPTQYEFKVIKKIFPIQGTITASKIVRKQLLGITVMYIAGSQGTVWGLNVKTHEMIEAWNVGEEIETMDVVDCSKQKPSGSTLASNTMSTIISTTSAEGLMGSMKQGPPLGTLIMVGTSSGKIITRMNFNENSDKIMCQSKPKCILIYQDHTFALVGCKDNFLYLLSNNQRGSFSITKKISLPSCPTSLAIIQKKLVLVSTVENNLYIVSLKDAQCKLALNSTQKYKNPVVKSLYRVTEKGIDDPIIFGAESKALMSGKANGSIDIWRNTSYLKANNKISLNSHASYLSGLSLSEDQIKVYSSGFDDHMIVDWNMRFFLESDKVTMPRQLVLQAIEHEEDQLIQRELHFCQFNNSILSQLYDQHLLVRGIENETLCKLFKGMIEEWKDTNVQPQASNPPQITLKLDYVFGIQTFNKRSTVFVLKDPKRFVYFISRVVVVYDPATNSQAIYTGHRYKVTCIVPVTNQTIASGQSAYRPTIKIWRVSTLQTLRVINTVHRWGIIQIISSQNTILSYGFHPNHLENDKEVPETSGVTFSLQLTDIMTGQIYGARTQKQPVYALAIDPLCSKQFLTTGFNNVTFWEIKSHNILRQGVAFPNQEIVTCALYYVIGNQEADVIIGTKKGSIGVIVRQRKYIEVRENAHAKAINCMRMVRRKPKQPLFVTASEDETLKVWNKKFELVYEQNVRKIDFEDYVKGFNEKKSMEKNLQRNLAIQSICPINEGSSQLNFLIATRNGDVVEIVEDLEIKNQSQGVIYGDLKYVLYLKSHSSQHPGIERKKVLIAHHPKYEIIVSISEDQNLLFWDTEKNKLIMNKTLGYTAYPTAIKFNKDGDFLIVGYSDGLVIFLDSKLSKSIQGKNDEKFLLPSLSIVKREPSKEGAAVLNIEISDSGDHLAVSFNNKISSSGDNNQNEHSYISLFLNKNREKTKHFNKIENDRIFQKFTSISRQHAENIYVTEKNNKYGLAAYSMAFAQSEGKFYLLIYYQLVDSNQNRLNYTKDGRYVVWDVNTSTVIANLDLVSTLNWKKFCFPNSVYCKYQLYNELISKKTADYESEPINNNLLIPHMSAMANLTNHLIMGSVNGDIHIVKTSCLQYPNIFQHYPSQQQMFIAKTFPGHCSQINQLQLNLEKSIFYSTSISDQCIFKWKVQGDPAQILPDIQVKQAEENDLFSEVPTLEMLSNDVQYYRRKENSIGFNSAWKPEDFIDKLKVIEIIGRKAFTARNNLKFDCSGRIIYSVGYSLVAYDHENNVKDFLYLEDDFSNVSHDISCFVMSCDKRFAFVCHNGSAATIVIWQVNSRTPIKKIILNTVLSILMISLSDSDQRALLLTLDSKRRASIMLLDIKTEMILGVVSYFHVNPWAIKALAFYPQSQSKFITCGVESTKSWQLAGSMLTYKDLDSKMFFNEGKFISLCASFIGEKELVTGCDDGSLILWKQTEFVRKSQHSDMVLILSASFQNSSLGQMSTLLGSGSRDGTVLIWKYEDSELFPIKRLMMHPKIQQLHSYERIPYEVQSLVIDREKILIGTRSGNIYEHHLKMQSLNQNPSMGPVNGSGLAHRNKKQDVYQPDNHFVYHDNQTPKSFFFHQLEGVVYLYQITNRGSLTIWRFRDYKKVWSYNFAKETVQMLQSAKNGVFYIAFKSEIQCFSLMGSTEDDKIDEKNPISSHSIHNITHMLMSPNQKMIAIGHEKLSSKQGSLQQIEAAIQIYDVKQFKIILRIPLNGSLQFMDMSKNNAFFMMKTVDSILVRDLTTSKNINLENSTKIEWSGDGLLYSKKAEKIKQNIYERFSMDENIVKEFIKGSNNNYSKSQLESMESRLEIGKVVDLDNNDRFIVVDVFGRVFVYASEGVFIAQCRMNSTQINKVVVSEKGRYVALGSEADRSIVILEVGKLY